MSLANAKRESSKENFLINLGFEEVKRSFALKGT